MMTSGSARIAVIGTGGTIASVAADSLDLLDYTATADRVGAAELIARVPEASRFARLDPLDIGRASSVELSFSHWKELWRAIEELSRAGSCDGIVVTHGTSTLEETAYFLQLTSRADIPVVVVGSQRPLGALSSDAATNLVDAVRVAADPASRGRGVLVVCAGEIHAAREATKVDNLGLRAFGSPGAGPIGAVDVDAVSFTRMSVRRGAPDSEFDLGRIAALPRVDLAITYSGSDGTGIRALVAAGARGLVVIGFAPGYSAPGDIAAMEEAAAAGLVVMQASRARCGRVYPSTRLVRRGIFATGDLGAEKARILLGLALATTDDRDEIARIFAEY
jgi:L-asparaginase